MKGKYKININIIDNFNDTNVITIKTKSIEEIEKNIKLIKKTIKDYDDENYKKCHQCSKYNHINDMSSPEGLDNILICQECLQDIIDGKITLKNI